MLQPLFLSAFSDVLSTAFSSDTPHFYLIWGFAIGFFLAILANYVNRRLIGRLPRKLAEQGATSPETARSLQEIGCANFLYRFCLRKGSMLRKLIRQQDEKPSDIAQFNAENSNIEQKEPSCCEDSPCGASMEAAQEAAQEQAQEQTQEAAQEQAQAQNAPDTQPPIRETEGAKEPSLPRATDRFYIPKAHQYRLERTYSASPYMELQVLLSAPALAALAVFVFWVLPKFL